MGLGAPTMTSLMKAQFRSHASDICLGARQEDSSQVTETVEDLTLAVEDLRIQEGNAIEAAAASASAGDDEPDPPRRDRSLGPDDKSVVIDLRPCPECGEEGEYDPVWASGACPECRMMNRFLLCLEDNRSEIWNNINNTK